MRVNHIIPSLSTLSGGPARSVPLLCRALAEYADVDISTVKSPDEVVVCGAVSVQSFPSSYSKLSLGCSVSLRDHLLSIDCDVINAHCLWLMSTHYAVLAASKLKKPIIITPRGMLEPGALQFSKWKKRLAGWLWQNRDLQRATCIHVTSQMEADNCRKYGLKNPIAIVPNGIELSEYPLKPAVHELRGQKLEDRGQMKPFISNFRSPTSGKQRKLLFLSRIHQKKGLFFLLKAWAQLNSFHENWQLVIAGNDDGGHEAELKKLASELGLQWTENVRECDSVSVRTNDSSPTSDLRPPSSVLHFAGPLFGDDKIRAYQEASLFVLPTLSENFGMVVPEALACGTPVITTKGAPWQELEGTESGWWIDMGTEPLTKCLNEALARSTVELNEMGRRGRKLVENCYSIDSVAKQMMQVYEWVLGGGQAPACVRFD